ncbi:MAG: glycoside hydrolase [Spirochaetaceae bacterium]
MSKVLKVLKNIITITAVISLITGSYLFMKFNAPIIDKKVILYVTLALNLIGFIAVMFINRKSTNSKLIWLNLLGSLLISGFLIYSLITSVIVDFFQPLSLYDLVIYLALGGLVPLMFLMLGQSITALFTKKIYIRSILSGILLLTFILQFYILGTQQDFEYSNIDGDATAIFESGESDYNIFRIPSLLVLPKGSKLKNGTILQNDQVIVMAEARRNGSLDHGDIDLVQKVSSDGGITWSDLIITSTYEPGIGKIGNSTPIFDSITGEIILLHISGNKANNFKTYKKISSDGGFTWSDPELVYDGFVGPGHGIMIDSGIYKGRLVAPGYIDGGSLSLYSDDHGLTWQTSDRLDDGNESEIAQVNEIGDLMMVVRTNSPVSLPHAPLKKIYVTSDNGGESWSDFKTLDDIKEPICMSSIVESNGVLYYSHPDDYYSRGQMTIAASYDQGNSFSDRKLIYQGASGYSVLGVLSDGNLLLAFENGAIEYDERITLVKVQAFK